MEVIRVFGAAHRKESRRVAHFPPFEPEGFGEPVNEPFVAHVGPTAMDGGAAGPGTAAVKSSMVSSMT